MIKHSTKAVLFLLLWLLQGNAVLGQNRNQHSEGRTLFALEADTLDSLQTARAINIDVFFCEGDADRQVSAVETASAIATFARLRSPHPAGVPASAGAGEPEMLVRSVRLRPVPSDINRGNASDEILISADDPVLKNFLRVLSQAAGVSHPINVVPSSLSENYVRIFNCRGVDLKSIPGRVFLQIARKDQEQSAKDAIGSLSERIQNARVVTGIELVSSRAPVRSEVRYFFESDRELAEQVRVNLTETFKVDFQARLLEKLSSQTTAGTIEVWFGQSFKPSSRSVFTICVGQYREACPRSVEWLPCGASVESWAASRAACKSITSRRVGPAISGNACGYVVFEVACLQ